MEAFQSELSKARRARQAELNEVAAGIRARLAGFKGRFDTQLSLQLETGQLKARDKMQRKVEAMFRNWENWISDACVLLDEPNPHVDIKAVFRRSEHGV